MININRRKAIFAGMGAAAGLAVSGKNINASEPTGLQLKL